MSGGVYIEPGYKVGRLTVRELVVDGNANQRRWLCDAKSTTKEANKEANNERLH